MNGTDVPRAAITLALAPLVLLACGGKASADGRASTGGAGAAGAAGLAGSAAGSACSDYEDATGRSVPVLIVNRTRQAIHLGALIARTMLDAATTVALDADCGVGLPDDGNPDASGPVASVEIVFSD